MEKTTLYLPPELHRALRDAARQTGKSQAALVREAVAAYLAQMKRPVPRSLGVAEDPGLTGRGSEDWLEETWAKR